MQPSTKARTVRRMSISRSSPVYRTPRPASLVPGRRDQLGTQRGPHPPERLKSAASADSAGGAREGMCAFAPQALAERVVLISNILRVDHRTPRCPAGEGGLLDRKSV